MSAANLAKSSLHFPKVIEKSARVPFPRPALIAFVNGTETEASLQNGLSGLSFADAKILRGGIVRAIRHLNAARSPNVLMVDISDSDMPLSRVRELAEVCEPGTTVIVIGNCNDVGLYRELKRAGISEYIVKPVTTELLAQTLFSAQMGSEVAPINRKLGKMIGVVGARGGVGATTLAVNLAWYLANRQSRRVALVDLDLQNGGCGLALNLKPAQGLREALTNPARIDSLFLERAMTTRDEHLYLLSSEEPLREEMEFTPDAVSTLLNILGEHFHYVVIDLPRITAAPYQLALDTANRRIIVGDRTLLSTRDTARLRAALGGSEAAYRNLFVINRSGEGGRNELTLEEISNHTSVEPKIVIPFQPRQFAAAGFRGGVVAERPGKFAEAIASLAAEISGHSNKRLPWWRR